MELRGCEWLKRDYAPDTGDRHPGGTQGLDAEGDLVVLLLRRQCSPR